MAHPLRLPHRYRLDQDLVKSGTRPCAPASVFDPGSSIGDSTVGTSAEVAVCDIVPQPINLTGVECGCSNHVITCGICMVAELPIDV